MASSPKQFRVGLVEWVSYSIVLEADSAEAAKDDALRRFSEDGTEGFKCHENGIEDEGVIVDEWPPS